MGTVTVLLLVGLALVLIGVVVHLVLYANGQRELTFKLHKAEV